MPCILLNHNEYDANEAPCVEREEPELKPNPFSRSIISRGRSALDKPGEKTLLSDEMIAELPTIVWVNDVQRCGIPDYFYGEHGIIVSERFKEKLEDLEPGAHGFFPVSVRHDRKKTEYGIWYRLYLHQKPDLIDHENTLYAWFNPEKKKSEAIAGMNEGTLNDGFPRFWDFNVKRASRDFLINFKQPPSGHLWRGTIGTNPRWWKTDNVAPKWGGGLAYRDTLERVIFASDELADWMRREGITGCRPQKITERPVTWFFEKYLSTD